MATLKDYTDTLVNKGASPSAAAHYDLLVGNEQALTLGVYGDRKGGIVGHNHGSRGGKLLTRPLLSMALGPYSRPGSGAAPLIGLPVYPPQAGIDFGAIAGTSYKLLLHCGVYLPGGTTSVLVRAGVNFTGGVGTRSFTLAFVMRSTSKIGLRYYAVGNFSVSAIATFQTTGANNFVNAAVSLAPLSRLGDVNQSRWNELLIVLINNPTAATTARLIGFKVDPVVNADMPPPNVVGMAPVNIDPRDIQAGAHVLENLLKRAAALFDGLILATLGRIPGKTVNYGQPAALEDKTSKYRAAVEELNASKGIHQHTGSQYFDGPLIPGQLATLCPVDDMGDDGASQSNAFQVQGALVDPTGAGGVPANLRKFRLRVPIARGDKRLMLKLAFFPNTNPDQAFLWMFCRSRFIVQADYNATVISINSSDPFPTTVDTDIITSIEAGQQYPEASKAAGNYWQIQLQPENCDLCQPNEARTAANKFGHWTNITILPSTAQPQYSLGLSQIYRVSKALTLNLDPRGRTGDVLFEFAFYLLDGTGLIKNTGRLQWLVLARPEEA